MAVGKRSRSLSSTSALLRHPKLWRAGELARLQAGRDRALPTGFEVLDVELPDQGWPTSGLMELLLPSAGMGELRLLAPALRQLAADPRWIVCIAPPFRLYAPALQQLGLSPEQFLIAHPQDHKDLLWSVERASKSPACACVLAWPDEQRLKLKDTQRLQFAAKQGRTLACLFRPVSARLHSSMAELRLAARELTDNGMAHLDIVKRRGGWPLENLAVPLADTTASGHTPPEIVQQQLALWRAQLETSQGDGERAQREALAADEDLDLTAALPGWHAPAPTSQNLVP